MLTNWSTASFSKNEIWSLKLRPLHIFLPRSKLPPLILLTKFGRQPIARKPREPQKLKHEMKYFAAAISSQMPGCAMPFPFMIDCNASFKSELKTLALRLLAERHYWEQPIISVIELDRIDVSKTYRQRHLKRAGCMPDENSKRGQCLQLQYLPNPPCRRSPT